MLTAPDRQHWEAAVGYTELEMYLDADGELEKIDPLNRAAPEVLAVRLEIYRGLEKWELMAQIAKKLADFQADQIQWIVSAAYAIRRAESIEAAREILLNAHPRFPGEAIIPYNLACYQAQLGDLRSAKDYLAQAFQINAKWRLAALDDVDLQPLWETLK